MTQHVSDAKLGRFARQQADWFRRVQEGSLDPDRVSKAVHAVISELESHTRRPLLTALTTLTVASNTINPHDFFKTREGLWKSSNFNDFILSGASKKKVSADETPIGYADLAQAVNDAEIGSELPEGYVFEKVDTFLVHLAALIKDQWGGKNGALLHNGYPNIFYVKVKGEVCAVLVNWSARDRERWRCLAFRPVDYRWLAGSRAFSATAVDKELTW